MGSFARRSTWLVVAASALGACGLDIVGTTTSPGGASSSSGGPNDGGPNTNVDGESSIDAGEADVDVDAAVPPGKSGITIAVSDLGTSSRTIDLSAEGTLDWVYWAFTGNVADDERKANVVPAIGSPYAWGGTNVSRGTNTLYWPLLQTWDDGSALTFGSSTWYTYFNGSNDAAVTITAATSTTPRTLTLFAAASEVVASIEATLPDGTSSQASQDTKNGARYLRIAVTYQAATTGTSLEVRWRIMQRHNASPNAAIIVSSAALK